MKTNTESTGRVWEGLRQPPASYRSVPLWSWNDRLETVELERQIEEMNRAGIGGFFMHARGGLQTPYMEEEWMDAIRVSIEKAKSLGMDPWFYDENGWPSGFGGGQVTALGVNYQQKKLAIEHTPFSATVDNTIAYYAKMEHGYCSLGHEQRANAELRIYWELNPYYIDTLSQTAVRAFIESTYEAYWSRFGEEFKSVLKGVFTDEPQFGRGELPWSFELEETYRKRNGRELVDDLPGLFLNIEHCHGARYRYWACVTHMFVTSYAKQIGDWCESKGWSATGHVVDEQTLMQQATSVGDPLAFYEYIQIPGCDWLGRFVDVEPLVPKQVGSVARQLGKKRTITETYGCAGWNISFQDMKRIGEWQFVHGINMMCQHLQSYSLKGMRKRDYPPSLFHQQPWWSEYSTFNDYFARLSMLLAEGEKQADVLLLHPIRTAWTLQQGFDSSAIRPYHESFAMLSSWLGRSFIEHDYGSESIMERHGKVEDGQLIVGEVTYKAVVVPPSVTLSKSTVELLLQFQQQGGNLMMFAPYPTLVDGEPSHLLERLLEGTAKPDWEASAVVYAISASASPYVHMYDANGNSVKSEMVNVQTMQLDGSWLYFIVNSSESSLGNVTIELGNKGRVTILNLESGEEEPLEANYSTDTVRLSLPLLAAQSYMLKQTAASSSSIEEFTNEMTLVTSESIYHMELGGTWQVKTTDLNSLMLDTCQLSVAGGEWSEEQPILQLQQQLLELGEAVRIARAFKFDVTFDPSKQRELYLVMEQPDQTVITLNGVVIESIDCGWWLDIAFRKINIAGKAQPGTNLLVIESEFSQSRKTYEEIQRAKSFESIGNKLTLDIELESVYLLGEFGVISTTAYTDDDRRATYSNGPFVLTETPLQLETGDFVRQGFPFYAGTLRLEQSITLEAEQLRSDSCVKWRFVTPPESIVTRLLVNGHEVRTFLWEPFDADVSSYLKTGHNVIELEFINSCRNLLGPHHHIKGEVYKVGPSSFTDKVGWTDKDIPAGTNVYQDGYTFVRFGLATRPRLEWIAE